MAKPEEIFQDSELYNVVDEVTNNIVKIIHEFPPAELAPKISDILIQLFSETEFYRRISMDIQDGLKRIYKEISAVTDNKNVSASNSTKKAEVLFNEASGQLSEVLTQTEEAAITIMEAVERDMELQEESSELLEELSTNYEEVKPNISRLQEIHTRIDDDLNTILLSLSFQDLTGQRIKKAVSALKEIEKIVVELYLSVGLLLQAYKEDPHKNIDEIEAITRQQVSSFNDTQVSGSELKGPTSGVSQKNIDELLTQLGVDS